MILSDIRAKEYSTSEYPTNEDIEDSTDWERWIPESLKCFVQINVKSPLKQNSIAQSIIHASRPKSSMLPIPFGLGVEMDHVFGSK